MNKKTGRSQKRINIHREEEEGLHACRHGEGISERVEVGVHTQVGLEKYTYKQAVRISKRDICANIGRLSPKVGAWTHTGRQKTEKEHGD